MAMAGPAGDHGTPLVSVVITNHNYGRFVEEAVASALAQTYRPLEVVVVDDGSTDDSLERLQRFGDRIRLVALEHCAGHHGAAHAGIQASQGDPVCLLDADDRWAPTKVEAIMARFAGDADLTQVSHRYRTIDAAGAPLTYRRGTAGRWRIDRRMPLTEGDVRPHLLRWNRYGWGVTSGLAYRRWVLERAMPTPPEFAGEGLDTWTTVAAAFLGPVGAVDGDLMDYRIHGSNSQAGVQDFTRHVVRRRQTAAMVRHWAERTGYDGTVDPEQRDNELVLFRFLAGEPVPATQRARAVLRSAVELVDVDGQGVDVVMELARRSVMASSRENGRAVEAVGINRWVRDRARWPGGAASASAAGVMPRRPGS